MHKICSIYFYFIFIFELLFLHFLNYFIFSCVPASQMLQSNGDLKRKWTWAVEWLNDELERVSY